MKNLLIFDIDDTLTQSEDQHQKAFIEAMKHFGITDINENWVEYEHMTDSYILKENYENNLSKSFSFSFIREFENHMTKNMLNLRRVGEIMGAGKMIKDLQQNAKYAICCATGSLLQPALLKLEQAEINCTKEMVTGSNHSFSREEILQKAIDKSCDYYGISSFNHIISIGDGMWDYQTSKNLGIDFVGIGDKYKNQFSEVGVSYHLDDWMSFELDKMEESLSKD